MGGSLSCIDNQIPPLQRPQYDLSSIKTKSLPMVWLVGPPGCGRNTQAKLLSDNLGFSHIKVADLLRDEAEKDTDRGRFINEGLRNRTKKIPDGIVIDLIKEDMLRSQFAKGFLIDNFPRNGKQGYLFNKEIGEVDAIVYLICDTPTMVKRKLAKAEGRLTEEVIKRSIHHYVKDIKDGIARFGSKIEKINSGEDPDEVYGKIEAAINVRISMKTKITTESDYAQSQQQAAESDI